MERTQLGSGGGSTRFSDNSDARTALIINNGGRTNGAFEGGTGFAGTASAGNSTIVNNGASVALSSRGSTFFSGKSTAGSATIVANGGPEQGTLSGGHIEFIDEATGGTARIQVFGNGLLNMRNHTGSLTIGSLEGTGRVFLGANSLMIGSNDRSTNFAGSLRDGDQFGNDPTGGSVTKIGSGTWSLAATASTLA